MTTPSPLPDRLTWDQALALLTDWEHHAPERWLAHQRDNALLTFTGDPLACSGDQLWSLLLKVEADKLYNQAWCALDQIQSADDPEDTLMLAMDDLPSAVEQAWSLDPAIATEHLDLLRQHKAGRVERFLAEMAAGTDREPAERADSLAFWEDNAEITSPFRQRLYREVRAVLQRQKR